MSKALYRRYRPKTLSEVVGQKQVTDTLKRALDQGKISHAYLFVGPRGTGKTSVARIFAHEINGFEYELEDDYIDIIEIDGASNRGIDDIRELREKVTIAPSEGKYKVYIIDEVHMLTTPAFNALLKTLEEPPEHVVFIMATTDVHKVPKTILSRAQSFTFRLADAETMNEYLRKVAEDAGIKIDQEALQIVTQRGGGSFRDSLSLLDQISTLSEGEITQDLVVAAMGLPEEEEVLRLLKAYEGGELAVITEELKKVLGAGAKPELLAEGMIRKIIAEPKAEWLELLARLPEVAAPFPEAKLLVAMTKGLEKRPATTVRSKVKTGAEATPRVGTKDGGDAGRNVERGTGTENKVELSESVGAEGVKESTGSGASTKMESEKAVSEAGSKPAEIGGREAEANGQSAETSPFDWDNYVTKVSEMNDAIASQLKKVKYEVRGGTLHLYPERKVVRTILSRETNFRILKEVAVGLTVTLHEFGEKPEGQAKDENADKFAKLYSIMGGEVIEDAGGDPFE